jgi:2'-5' RNA ligase
MLISNNMLHRVFLAINLPGDIRKKLVAFQKQWPTLPIRWTEPENLHITLVFLGYLNDNQLNDTLKICREVAKRHKPFLITLQRVCYGPPKKFPPRMVWVEGKISKELAELQKDLENSIFDLPSYQYKEKEAQAYHPHITLGRMKQWEFRRLEDKPKIDEPIDLVFEVNSFEVMESQLKKGGAEYTVLESMELS